MESSGKNVELYYDKFEIRELGADAVDDLTGIGFWGVSNSNYGEIATEDSALKVHINRNNFSPVFSGFAFEEGEKYEISFKMKNSVPEELGTPALMIRGFGLENSYNESRKSYEYNIGSYINNATIKMVDATGFGANENWQKFSFVYEPSELPDDYVFSKIYIRHDNSAYNTESNELVYYIDDFSVRNIGKESNASIVDEKITVKNQAGKLYHIMQSIGGQEYSSVKYDFAEDIIEYSSDVNNEYYIEFINVEGNRATKKEKVVLDKKDEGLFTVTRPDNLTLENIKNGIAVTAINSEDDTKEFDVAVAGYDSGVLKSVKIIPVTVPHNCEAVKTVRYEGDAESVKIMVLDIDTMIPLLNVLKIN